MAAEKRPVAYRAGGFSPRVVAWLAAMSFVGIVGLIEVLCRTGAIGAYIIEQQNLFQLDRLMAGVVVLMMLGLTIHGLIGLLERWLLRWR